MVHSPANVQLSAVRASVSFSSVLRCTNRRAFHLSPVDAVVDRLVYEAYQAHRIPAYDIEPESNFAGFLTLVWAADHTLDGVLKDLQFSPLVLGATMQEVPDEIPTRFVVLSCEMSTPTRLRPSVVMMQTFSTTVVSLRPPLGGMHLRKHRQAPTHFRGSY